MLYRSKAVEWATVTSAGPQCPGASTINRLFTPKAKFEGYFLTDSSDEATMEIRFPADAPAYRDSNLTVVFRALVDGEAVPCAISVEALEDHFGARSEDREGWMRAFDAGRGHIEAVAREHLQISKGTPVLLKSGHFPPGNVEDV
jgi:hypothetical protein